MIHRPCSSCYAKCLASGWIHLIIVGQLRLRRSNRGHCNPIRARHVEGTRSRKAPIVTQQLDALVRSGRPETLCLSFAQVLAVAQGLIKTSPGIRFYRWLTLRTPEAQPAA